MHISNECSPVWLSENSVATSKSGAYINKRNLFGMSALHFYNSESTSVQNHNCEPEVKETPVLLFAAGEKDGFNLILKEIVAESGLKHKCRETIRKYFIDLDPHSHLFSRIPQLGLPSQIT